MDLGMYLLLVLVDKLHPGLTLLQLVMLFMVYLPLLMLLLHLELDLLLYYWWICPTILRGPAPASVTFAPAHLHMDLEPNEGRRGDFRSTYGNCCSSCLL